MTEEEPRKEEQRFRSARIFAGWWFVVLAGIAFVASIPQLFDPAAVVVINGVAESHIVYRLMMTSIFAVLVGAGVMILRFKGSPWGPPEWFLDRLEQSPLRALSPRWRERHWQGRKR